MTEKPRNYDIRKTGSGAYQGKTARLADADLGGSVVSRLDSGEILYFHSIGISQV